MSGPLVTDVREMFHEQVEYRELMFRMIGRDLLLRYKQTFMGFGWALFAPLLNTIVFSIIFTRVAPLETGVPYPLFAYCGLVGWNFFASSLKGALNSLTSNSTLVTKVYFPREVFPFSAVVVSLVDFAVASVLLFGMLAYYGIGISAAVLFLPVVVAVHVILTMGIALLLAMANLFYRDVKYLFEIVVSVWMFATPVVYPADLIGGRLGLLIKANPMTPIIEAYRAVLLRGELPAVLPFAVSAVVSLTVLLTAWLIFHRSEFDFAENI